ncbi:integrase family protein [Denitrovibrio acetiphilus DSM 12809]|jgi:integrase|uniref:Integrase family protein n=1 Tax=Denitrovibrio acetiphilus (strain DSM 12809 / NBRC 114555 / N2460) TaxID=522772 RepID=D4H4I0_DENA2|nr:site-specific integrase [Denitrovibrio acetiphilus]ADD69309.1 integrase family protein [Denitrovibrio acetiphilus DSM 12809]
MNTKKKLTDAVVRNAKPATQGSGYYYIWDTELKGFALRVTGRPTKSYVIRYRNEEGRQKVMTLFRASNITADEARRKARTKLTEAQGGTDILKEKQEKRKAMLFSEFAEIYLEHHARPNNSAGTVKTNESYLERLILPAFGNRPLKSITPEDTAKLHHKIGKSTPVQANRVHALLRKMFTLAETWRYIPQNTNPCVHTQKYKETPVQRFLTPDETKRLEDVLEKYEEKYYSAVLALRLLMYTGCRKEEILTLKWENIKNELNLLHIPKSKTGEKNVPVSHEVLDMLENAYKVNEYVCFGKFENSRLIGLQKIWERLRKEAGLEDVRIHDLRHSFASTAISGGINIEFISKLLGHKRITTTEYYYAHVQNDPLHEAANKIATSITTARKTGKGLRRVK